MARVNAPYAPASAFDVSGYVLVDDDGYKEVKRAFASGGTVADHPLVAAVTGKKIRVLAVVMTTVDGLGVTFKSASTAISAKVNATGAVFPYCAHGWFQTVAGEALNFALDAAETTGVHILYVEV
jgi:hypothetical protein